MPQNQSAWDNSLIKGPSSSMALVCARWQKLALRDTSLSSEHLLFIYCSFVGFIETRFHFVAFFRLSLLGPGEMTQWFLAPTALPEDLALLHNTHVAAHSSHTAHSRL